MKTCADYIAAAKAALGNPRMTDRELGVELGKAIEREPFANSAVNGAKVGAMSDRMAVAIATVTQIHPGEVLTVAKLARERDPVVKAAWEDWVGKLSGLLPLQNAVVHALAAGPDAPALAGIDVAMPSHKRESRPHGAASQIGGEGGIRTHGTLFTYA